jgi:5-methylcytosine-specific restriction endonuclease McrA
MDARGALLVVTIGTCQDRRIGTPGGHMNRPPISSDVRRAVLNRAKGGCEDCGSRGTLELHHLTYTHPYSHPGLSWAEESIFGYETPNDLVALCRECHHGRHIDANGDFWADPMEMENYWYHAA